LTSRHDIDMRQKLEEPIVAILKTRIYISRELGVIRLTQIAKGFGISGMTLHRYNDPVHRQKSIQYARNQTERARQESRNCWRCEKSLLNHKRCGDCEILIHDDEANAGFCASCIANRIGEIISR
jgi:hypothetical protein